MNNKNYEQKKRECWENFCDEHLFDPHNIITQGIFGYAFDRAFDLGKQEIKQETNSEETVISGWVARDSNESLYLFCFKPERVRYLGSSDGVWMSRTIEKLDSMLFPDLTWESAPLEVEIIIKRKKK